MMRLRNLSFFLIIYTLLVILWGAWVRISHSGDGCGESWPLCHGEVLPQALESSKTWVEYAHRAMSGVYGFLVLVYFFLARLYKSQGHFFFWVKWTLFFTVTEALFGAKLVIFGLVAQNDSPWRVFSMGLHFLNSLALVFSLTKSYLSTQVVSLKHSHSANLEKSKMFESFHLTLIPLLLIVLSGVIAALSNTLFPANDMLQALRDDFSSESHYLVRWRVWHPLLGFGIGVLLMIYFWHAGFVKEQKTRAFQTSLKKEVVRLSMIIGLVIGSGVFLILFKNYHIFKLLHLTLIYSAWIQWIRISDYKFKLGQTSS